MKLIPEPHPYETVAHLLFECPALHDLRKDLLPPSPDVGNTLYMNLEDLRETSLFSFFVMASSRRARAQMTTGSKKKKLSNSNTAHLNYNTNVKVKALLWNQI